MNYTQHRIPNNWDLKVGTEWVGRHQSWSDRTIRITTIFRERGGRIVVGVADKGDDNCIFYDLENFLYCFERTKDRE
jgi:hypothetical protein